jgi:hypothetical protein
MRSSAKPTATLVDTEMQAKKHAFLSNQPCVAPCNCVEIRVLTTNTWIKAFDLADIGIRKKIASRTPNLMTATEGLSGNVNSRHAPLIKE